MKYFASPGPSSRITEEAAASFPAQHSGQKRTPVCGGKSRTSAQVPQKTLPHPTIRKQSEEADLYSDACESSRQTYFHKKCKPRPFHRGPSGGNSNRHSLNSLGYLIECLSARVLFAFGGDSLSERVLISCDPKRDRDPNGIEK